MSVSLLLDHWVGGCDGLPAGGRGCGVGGCWVVCVGLCLCGCVCWCVCSIFSSSRSFVVVLICFCLCVLDYTGNPELIRHGDIIRLEHKE